MTITIVHAASMTKSDYPPADAYANHALAMEYSYGMTFEGGTPTSTGVFPTVAHAGVKGSDSHHVHAIVYAGVVYLVSVTFMNGADHVGNAFYFPTAGQSSTFSRFCTRVPKFDATARAIADKVFTAFFNACAKKSGKAANEAIVDAVTKAIATAAAIKKKEEEDRANAHKKSVQISESKKDQGLFAQNANKKMSDDEVVKRLEAYQKAGGTFMAGDEKMIKVALQDGRAKENWNSMIRKYYDAIMAVTI